MSQSDQNWTDERVEQVVGNLLRAGVLLAGFVVLAGGILYLYQYGTQPADHHTFHGEPEELSTVPGILKGALSLRSRAIIQLGLLLLIATPIARVIFAVYAFFRQRDQAYVVITLVVLAILLYSLLGGISP